MNLINRLIISLIYLNTAILLVPDRLKGLPIILLLILVLYRHFKLTKKPILLTKTYLISIGFFIIILFGVLYSSNFSYGLKKIETGLSLIVFPTIFFLISGDKIIINKKTIKTLKLTFIVSLMFFLILTFLYFYITEPFYTFKSTVIHYTNLVDIRINNYKIHPIYLSINIGIALVFTLSLLGEKEQKNKYIIVFLFLVLIAFMVILNKKGPIIFLVFLGVILLIKEKFNFKLILSTSLIFLIFLISIIFIPKYNNVNKFAELTNIGSLGKDDNSSTAIRLQIYECSIIKVFQYPFFGYGIGDVKNVLDDCYREKNKDLLKNNYNSHNQYLSILLSSGIIGFLAFAYYIFFVLKISNTTDSKVLFFLMVYFSLNMLTENILEREDGVIIISFLINFFLFSVKKKNISSMNNNYD